MSLLARVHALLDDRSVPHAMIGAAALAAHGVSRSTFDLDLLACDPACLNDATWAPMRASGASVDVRAGDADDPLLGVVRIDQPGERSVDVVLGRDAWQRAAVARATPVAVGGVSIPVVTGPDLVLLKLYAGGAQDRWDVALLLGGDERDTIVAAVNREIGVFPERCRALWERILSD